MSFGSDAAAMAPEGVFLLSNPHPRAYGNFARVLGRYVREEHAITLEDAMRRLSGAARAQPALRGSRPARSAGYFADVVVFDPQTIQDHATFEKPHQYSTGVSEVLVNGRARAHGGRAHRRETGGRFVRGRGWTGREGGGCRASSRDWSW